MKLKNISKETLRFECGTKEVSNGTVMVMEAGEMVERQRRKLVPLLYVVKPGAEIELADGYCVPRDGIMPRPSFLEESGLEKKLVPVEEPALEVEAS